MQRDYGAAVAALNTLQSNFSIVDKIRKSGLGMNQQAIPEMIEWCRRIGYEPSDFDQLRLIHIAGTKGKGSTSTFISSILAQHVNGTPEASGAKPIISKIGLFTSPHLRFVRERIQINNEPLSEAHFAKYFFEVWDRLEEASKAEGQDPAAAGSKPVYFRFLTLMAFHAYLKEQVDAAVIECGIGGEYDSTNIIVHPTVTAVTSLGIDHTAMLGSTLPEIAWHKAGIFKAGAAAFTVPQKPEALSALCDRAVEKGVDLHVVTRHPALDSITLGLSADFQKTNASLAIAVAAAQLRALGLSSIPDPTSPDFQSAPLPEKFRIGLENVRLPGRCETRADKRTNIVWHIDGGHTLESIRYAGTWFADLIKSSPASPESHQEAPRILIFNQQTRDASALARTLHKALSGTLGTNQPFTHAIFTTNQTYEEMGFKPDLVNVNANKNAVDELAVQKGLSKTWKELDEKAEVRVVRSIEEAIKYARDISGEISAKVLVTGSLHLVGGLMEVLESEE